jgi:hypothetical protein
LISVGYEKKLASNSDEFFEDHGEWELKIDSDVERTHFFPESFDSDMPASGRVDFSFTRGHLTTTRRWKFPPRFQEPQEPVTRNLFPETWLFESISDLG